MSAAERRELVLRAAQIEFGSGGYAGTSTEAIARRVGVSQPYLFRLFPSKKALFLATVDRCFDDMRDLFDRAAGDRTGDEALEAMGHAYNSLLDNREILQMQLQTWATACEDSDVRALARRRLSELWQQVERISGAGSEQVIEFMGRGMLLNVLAAVGLPRMEEQLGEALNGGSD
ncbi:TetR family transcriptional regulator [Planosporangium flavigriseum]|uniref:TetR family transcriptional regulator n=2 Tax=Planosporangium flavigriseum TaxID=373681 RepID=A0A8J3LRM9_9ACTN|nr:TetR family transcriptional regulator [Planosporangium flavigriseum]